MTNRVPPPPFTVPLPPPGLPLGHPPDVMILHSDDADDAPREHEDLMLRRVPRATAMRFRAGAGGRSLTHAQFLTALVELHARIRTLADAGSAELQAELDALGLRTVEV